jgi:hypothetical protein
MTNRAKLASLMILLTITGCGTAPVQTPTPPAVTSPPATASAWKCSDFLRHGKSEIAVPPSIKETGCTDDSGHLAAPETLFCVNGTKLVFVDHWAITPKVVVDLRTTPDTTLRQSCLGG